MLKPCERCSCSGFIVGMPVVSQGTAGPPGFLLTSTPCPKCKGAGWYDPDELVTVPREWIKDEYWEKI